MKNNIKLFLLSGVVASSLVLQGCGGSDTEKAPTPTGPDAYEVGSHPRFDPVISDVPFNSDLVFAKASISDGTADVGAATDPVRAALNKLDGFSTSAYFDILIDGSVDPDTAIPSQTVFLVEVQSNGDALDPANIVGLVGPASFDVRVVSLDGGTNNAIRLRPTEPLKAKTKYLVFLTNDIQDMSGEPLTRSWSYNAIRDPEYQTLSALLPVRAAITGWETLASGFLQVATEGALDDAAAKSKLILTYTFTTTDPLAPLMAMGAPRAAIAGAQIAGGASPEVAVGNAVALENAGLLSTPKARSLGVSSLTGIDFNTFNAQLAASVGKLYTGYISLPYYQTKSYWEEDFSYLTANWQPSLVLAGALGQELPTDIDGSYNVTYRYPFAAKQVDETVPLQVTMPESGFVSGLAGNATCSQIFGESGYPVVIYVHGITSDRTSVLALGHTLASKCVATVAIDLPLHGIAAYSSATGGSNPLVNVLNVEKSQLIPFADLYGNNTPHERHFNIAGAGGAPAAMNFDTPTARDGSGAQFINLGYLANTRDNNRQAVMDLLNLNASLGALSDNLEDSIGVGLNTDRVYVVGISLGGILGSIFATVNEASILNEQAANLSSNLNPIQGVVLSTAGTQVSQILVNSATFAPVINGGLAASGVNVGTSNYERFLYAAQSTLDSADPVNFMTTLSMLGVPVLVQQVNGDLVIPNSADSAPLAGTSAMASLLGANQLGLGNAELGLGYVKMTAGDHVSLLRPTTTAPQVTAELQTQVATFVLTSGTVTVGAEASGDVEEPLDPCACMPPQ